MLQTTANLKKIKNDRGDIVQTIIIVAGFAIVVMLALSFVMKSVTNMGNERMYATAQVEMEKIVQEIESLKVESGGTKSDVIISRHNLSDENTATLTISYNEHFSTIQNNIPQVVFSATTNEDGDYTLYAKDSSLLNNSRSSSSKYLNISEVPSFLSYYSSTDSFEKINGGE